MTSQPQPAQSGASGDQLPSGIYLIAAERKRQVEVEGWTAEHDAVHAYEQLARAAACYAMPASYREFTKNDAPYDWPFEEWWWKPTPHDRIRELVKAGALIAAEIDRLQREQRNG